MITADVPGMPLDSAAVERRADSYWHRCSDWLDAAPGWGDNMRKTDPRAVVARLYPVVKVEVRRALAERQAATNRDAAGDAYASAATALIAIEHSRRAWLALVAGGRVRPVIAQPFVCDLVWLRHELERAFPGMRLFPSSENADVE